MELQNLKNLFELEMNEIMRRTEILIKFDMIIDKSYYEHNQFMEENEDNHYYDPNVTRVIINYSRRRQSMFDLVIKYNDNIEHLEIIDTIKKFNVFKDRFIFGLNNIIMKYIKLCDYKKSKIDIAKLVTCECCEGNAIRLKKSDFDIFKYCVSSCLCCYKHTDLEFKFENADLLYTLDVGP